MNQEEINELACTVLGLDYDKICQQGFVYETIDEKLFDKFEIGIDGFSALVKALLPLTPIVVSGLSGKKYHAFMEKGCYGGAIVKQEVEEEERSRK